MEPRLLRFLTSTVYAAGAIALLYVSTMPAISPTGRFSAAIAATLALALLGLAAKESPERGLRRDLPLAAEMLLVLSPIWLLYSAVFVSRSELGILHPVTILVGALAYGLPILAGARLVLLPPRRSREWFVNLTLAAVSAAVVLLAVEAGIRVYHAAGHAERAWRRTVGTVPIIRPQGLAGPFSLAPGGAWGHQYSSNERGTFGPDNTVRYRLNGEGFRDDEFVREKAPNTLRLALLGDSFGFGEGVERSHTVAALMEEKLTRSAGCPVEVYNFSVPGYATIHEAAQLRDVVLGYDPDLVVIWYFLNDVEVAGTMAFLGYDEPAIFFPELRHVSALARFAGSLLDARVRERRLIRAYREGYEPGDSRWNRCRNALGSMGRLLRERKIPGVVFVHPVLFQLGAGYPFEKESEIVMDAARQDGMEAFDLIEAFRGKDGPSLWVHVSDQHPNEEAHAIAAGYAAAKLAPLLPACGAVDGANGSHAAPATE